MDQLSAHLDRGWDLVQQGDLTGARSSALRALELEPDAPEVHNLLGYVAALDGDCEEAIEAYEQALLLDETYVEVMLSAAELYLHPLGEYDEVLRLCDQVLELSEFEDETLDALLLKFEALAGSKDTEAAEKVLSRLPPGPYAHPAQRFLVGRAHFELGKLDEAERLLGETIDEQPDHADAHYYFGLLQEERGDRRGAVASFLHSREIELALGAPPWTPAGETFTRFTQRAIEALAPELRRWLQDAEVYISDLPGAEVVVDGVDPRALVLLDPPPPPDEQSPRDPSSSPIADNGVRAFLYAVNLVKAAGGLQALQSQIQQALESEIRATFLDSPARASQPAAAERAKR